MTVSDAPGTDPERAALRDRVLDATLGHIAFDGWSRAALAAGGRDEGIDAAVVGDLFPGGARDALTMFSRRADRTMAEAFAAADTSELRIHEKIMLAVELRLDLLVPHREAVRRGLSFLALPPNAPLGAKLLYRTVDDIWFAAGDRAADFSFYTKRALLAGVVGSTTLYWLDDASEEFAATHEFLERRIADVMRIHRARGRAEELGRRTPNPLRILREAVERRYGFGDRRVT